MDDFTDYIFRYQSPPIAKYNRNTKDISVTYAFNFGAIPIKTIASREKWLEFWEKLDFVHVDFKTIKPQIRISRPKQGAIEALQRYAKENPEDFAYELFLCVHEALAKHPHYEPAYKPRGGSPYDKTWSEMNEIKATSAHLYIYLKHNQELPPEEQTVRLDLLFEAYDVDSDRSLEAITKDIIEVVFNAQLDIEYLEFYKKYILHLPLRHLEKSQRIKDGNSPFLKKVFARIQNHKA